LALGWWLVGREKKEKASEVLTGRVSWSWRTFGVTTDKNYYDSILKKLF
jgi:hypothetical protein